MTFKLDFCSWIFVSNQKCPRKKHFKTQSAIASAGDGEPEMSLPDLVNDQVALVFCGGTLIFAFVMFTLSACKLESIQDLNFKFEIENEHLFVFISTSYVKRDKIYWISAFKVGVPTFGGI